MKNINNKLENCKNFILAHKVKLFFTLLFTIVAIVILYIFITTIFFQLLKQIGFEKNILSFANKNKSSVFSVNQITLFSSSDAKNKVSSPSNFTIENLYTYTDIAIFINQTSPESQLENTLKTVSIKNISIDTPPREGHAALYYKNLNDFAKPYIPDNYLIDQELTFNTLANETNDFSKPVLYNNCANPIILSYINENIKTDYTILDTATPITYNGSLLKRCGVALSTIASQISFDIYITNNKDEKFKSKIFISIPYEADKSSIYDGNITIKKDVNFVFYRYE